MERACLWRSREGLSAQGQKPKAVRIEPGWRGQMCWGGGQVGQSHVGHVTEGA